MAVTVLDTVNNRWYVQRSNGELELCHNSATAKTLCRYYDREEGEKWLKAVKFLGAYQSHALAVQEAV